MGDGLGDALAELDKDGLAGWARGGAFDGGGQLGLAVLQLGGLGGECLQSGGEVDVAESAGLEGEPVALDRFFGAAQLGLDHIEFVLVLVADPVQAGGDGLDG